MYGNIDAEAFLDLKNKNWTQFHAKDLSLLLAIKGTMESAISHVPEADPGLVEEGGANLWMGQ